MKTPVRTYAASGDTWRDPGELAATIAADLPEALVCYDDKLALALMDELRKLQDPGPRRHRHRGLRRDPLRRDLESRD